MRASRLLQILLLLQNRGRMTSAALAEELEVAQRTILRDVDALTEAGLPIIAHQGNQGGIELGFNYRTRLTGLSADEAEAMAVILTRPMPELEAIGLKASGERARSKMLESFPDAVREKIDRARGWFRFAPQPAETDPRLAALADAVRGGKIVRLRATTPSPQTIHPEGLLLGATGWAVIDARDAGRSIPIAEWGDVNISAKRFRVSS
ncbi:MAG: HTH domain-containing protein [Pseudomonadota bacterium]